MPVSEKYLADFEPGNTYHVYNRTNNKEKLFLSDDNRSYFLQKYLQFLSPLVDTYCWSLLSNHFHFLNKIKSNDVIISMMNDKKHKTLNELKFLDGEIAIGELIEGAYKRFFQSYAISFNNTHNRKGNLFYKPFKRVLVEKDTQFTQAIVYVHANPVKHSLISDFTQYKWSSWQEIISNKPTLLLRDELFDWFGSREKFIQAHYDLTKYYYQCEISIEE